jgi:TonB family protein
VQTFLLLLMLSTSLQAQCDARYEQSSKAQTNTTQQTNALSQKVKDECDFSSYKPATVSHFVQFALKTKVKPEYPTEAVQRGIQGKISVKILVDRDGNVVKACALNGDEVLRRAAEEAALQWKFKRNVVAGRQSYVQAGISFNFVLGESDAKDANAVFTLSVSHDEKAWRVIR